MPKTSLRTHLQSRPAEIAGHKAYLQSGHHFSGRQKPTARSQCLPNSGLNPSPPSIKQAVPALKKAGIVIACLLNGWPAAFRRRRNGASAD
ncbi:hypothetical protein AYM39_19195 [Methylomonas sp. DH-1]|nr:hypothetical protein AYM39_19195 [Methylomonas sp. DH-1]